MQTNPVLGTLVFLLGGVAAATYLLPFRAVRGWRYETGWLVNVLVGWLVFPLVFDAFVIPVSLSSILSQGGWPVFARTFAFGALWGIGALCWALMVRYLGIGLGLGIGAGICAATGTILPPIVTGNAAALVATKGACIVLAGIAVSLVGIALVGAAGRLKESEMNDEAKRRAVAEFNFTKGLVMAVVAGVASAGINFGLQGAQVWEDAAIGCGVSPTWAGMPVLTVVLWGGLLTQVVWVLSERWRRRNGDWSRDSAAPHAGLPAHLRNFALSAAVGVIGAMQFVLQKAGEPLMGDFRYISFAVLMSGAVFFSTLLGVFLGEWKGASRKTISLLSSGTVVIVAGFTMMSLGGR